jgi:Mg2+/citrate symporter
MSEAEDQLANQRKQLTNRTKISKELAERALNSHTSYWPFALAVALVIVLVSIMMTNPIVFGIGVVSVAVAAIGWGLENR